jgi:hypothetical protein
LIANQSAMDNINLVSSDPGSNIFSQDGQSEVLLGSGGSGDDLDRRNYLAGKKSEGLPKKMATVRNKNIIV